MGETARSVAAEESPEQLEHDIEEIRDDLSAIVNEIDHRREEALDWRVQLHRHAGAVAAGATALVVFGTGLLILNLWRARRHDSVLVKAHRLREALGRAIAAPENVARPTPGVGKKVLAAAISGAAGVLARNLTRAATTPSAPIASNIGAIPQ